MMENKTTLFGKGAYGTKEWSIWSEGNKIIIDANSQIYTETVPEGKAGRSLKEQIDLRINARIRSKLDSGFKRSKEELGDTITNQLGLVKPMLASSMDALKFSMDKAWIQPKLDGHRCLINEDGAYSRAGRVIDTIPEIIKSIRIPDGITLDGELYCHGVPLQTISSWAKRRQENTKKLKFHIYDAVIPGLNFAERFDILKEVVKENQFIELVDTRKVDPEIAIDSYWYDFRTKGYEGAILRNGYTNYEAGIRSKGLIKVKKRQESEFKCVDIEPSRDGYGILILETKEGKRFKTFAPGTYDAKIQTLLMKERFIGRNVTCEYPNLTDGGVPFHCVAVRWRLDL
jgi:DNA ligase-1